MRRRTPHSISARCPRSAPVCLRPATGAAQPRQRAIPRPQSRRVHPGGRRDSARPVRRRWLLLRERAGQSSVVNLNFWGGGKAMGPPNVLVLRPDALAHARRDAASPDRLKTTRSRALRGRPRGLPARLCFPNLSFYRLGVVCRIIAPPPCRQPHRMARCTAGGGRSANCGVVCKAFELSRRRDNLEFKQDSLRPRARRRTAAFAPPLRCPHATCRACWLRSQNHLRGKNHILNGTGRLARVTLAGTARRLPVGGGA